MSSHEPAQNIFDEENAVNSSSSRSSSDYGSDFSPDESELLNQLLAQADATVTATVTVQVTTTTTITTPTTPQLSSSRVVTTPKAVPGVAPSVIPAVRDIEDCNEDVSNGRVPRVLGRERQVKRTGPYQPRVYTTERVAGCGGAASVEHPDSTEGRERQRERDVAREQAWVGDPMTVTDSRSPVERFRRPPNKAFSVTDLVSPAWCEVQYWYTLTKHGRKRRTPAMKQGTTIHKSLEDEIYTTVPVEITTKEDALALRIWNVIQGLRTLREFGITRELEIWGLVDGELVNGVIDQLSYECPDSELEASAASHYAEAAASRAIMPEYQMSLTDYLLSPAGGGRRLDDLASHEQPQASEDHGPAGTPSSVEIPHVSRIYLTDIKTRGSKSIPTVKSSSFRPTMLQLQLYYHMLNRLVTSDDVSIELLASRYELDPKRSFTDAFITEVGSLNDHFFDALSSLEFDPDFIQTPEDAITRHQSPQATADLDAQHCPPSASQDSTTVLLAHNNLTSLWNLMKDHLKLTFLPTPSSSSVSVAPSIPSESQPQLLQPYPTIISPLLTACYLSSSPSADLHSRVLGTRSFLFDPPSLKSYLSDQMDWWRGERTPRGVEVMEAWKCRICEFQDECEWRQEREWSHARRKRVQKEVPDSGA